MFFFPPFLVNTIKRLRTEMPQSSPPPIGDDPDTNFDSSPEPEPEPEPDPLPRKQMRTSHMANLGGAKAARASFTYKRHGNTFKVPEKFSGNTIIAALSN